MPSFWEGYSVTKGSAFCIQHSERLDFAVISMGMFTSHIAQLLLSCRYRDRAWSSEKQEKFQVKEPKISVDTGMPLYACQVSPIIGSTIVSHNMLSLASLSGSMHVSPPVGRDYHLLITMHTELKKTQRSMIRALWGVCHWCRGGFTAAHTIGSS